MGIIRDEKGVMLVVVIILLLFVSLFLFSIASWHDILIRTYSSLEIYYEKEAIEIMRRDD